MARRPSSQWVVPAALFVVLFLDACAPEASATALPTPEPIAEPTAAEGRADPSAFCASYPPLIQAFMDSPLSGDGEAASQLESTAIIGEAEKLAAVVAASGGLAPEELGPSFGRFPRPWRRSARRAMPPASWTTR